MKKAYLKANVWGNFYLIVSRRKVRDWKATYNKITQSEILDWIEENYPQYKLINTAF